MDGITEVVDEEFLALASIMRLGGRPPRLRASSSHLAQLNTLMVLKTVK
jgi:hypothetical protein